MQKIRWVVYRCPGYLWAYWQENSILKEWQVPTIFWRGEKPKQTIFGADGFEMGMLVKGKLPKLQQNPLFGKMK